MKLFGLGAFVFALVTAYPLASHDAVASESLATDRYVQGVITSVEPAVVTIASSQHAVTGRIDPLRTKVTIKGKPAKLADLRVSGRAKAELCLDDVWVSIDAH